MNSELPTEKDTGYFHAKEYYYTVSILILSAVCVLLCIPSNPGAKPFLLLALLLLVCFAVWCSLGYCRTLHELRNVLHIQQILLDASREHAVIGYALQKTGDALAAESVYFLKSEDGSISENYEHECDKTTKPLLSLKEQAVIFNAVSQYAAENKALMWKKKKHNNLGAAVKEIMAKHKIRNMAYIKTSDPEHNILGIMLALNVRAMTKKHYFESISNSLLTAVINVSHIRVLENMGKYDSLTGLLNRNSYQALINEYQHSLAEHLACIYIDLNGLHNLNNQFGHEAGDQMLRRIANALVKYFGDKHTFRIGGDEFVIFCKDENKKGIEDRLETMQQELLDAQCHVSVGMEWCQSSADILEAVKRAEAKMYEAKNAYYKTISRI